jgi:glycine cleavage system H protein
MAEDHPAPPDDRRYSKEHEWARPGADANVVTVGITDYAAGELGDVVYVSLPAVGAVVKQFEQLGEVESVKAVSDLFAPVSGEVIAVNEALTDQPELVNASPFDQGWMVQVRLSDPGELAALMDSPAYQGFLAEQGAAGGH